MAGSSVVADQRLIVAAGPTLEPVATGTARAFIDAYLPGGFRVGGTRHDGPILVWPGGVAHWPVEPGAPLTPEDIAPVLAIAPPVEVLLIGIGPRMRLLPAAVRAPARAAGIGVDVMDTGAACRTYNVLVAEMRRVAAALLPLPEVPPDA